jgi:uncharacterized membrane protein YvbJ
MNCPSCGRALAGGAQKCVFCGHGNQFKRPSQLQIPKGTIPERRSSFPWGKLIVLVILAGAVAAAFLHPDLNAKIRSLIRF